MCSLASEETDGHRVEVDQISNSHDLFRDTTETVHPPVPLVVGCCLAVGTSLVLFIPFHIAGADRLVHALGYLLAGLVCPLVGIAFRHIDRQRRQSGFDYRRNQLLQNIVKGTLLAGVFVAMAHAFLGAADRILG